MTPRTVTVGRVTLRQSDVCEDSFIDGKSKRIGVVKTTLGLWRAWARLEDYVEALGDTRDEAVNELIAKMKRQRAAIDGVLGEGTK